MQIEVTKEEALEIYRQRYSDSRSKLMRYLPVGLFYGALALGATLICFGYDWLGITLFLAIVIPDTILIHKQFKASKRYAEGQIDFEGAK